MAEKKLRLAWIVPQLSASVASTRYRCYYPAIALREVGVDSQYFADPKQLIPHLDSIDAIIVVKTFDPVRLDVVSEAKARGVKIYLDLCDNVVVSSYAKERNLRQTASLAGIAALADGVVFASPALRDAIRPLLLPSTVLAVIPDQIETQQTTKAAAEVAAAAIQVAKPKKKAIATFKRRTKAVVSLLVLAFTDIGSATERVQSIARRIALRAANPMTLRGRTLRLSWMIVQNPKEAASITRRWLDLKLAVRGTAGTMAPVEPALVAGAGSARLTSKARIKRVIWFGNYGAPHSDFGMLALLQTAHALEAVARDIPLELVVISNNEEMFDSFIKPISVPTRYEEWSSEGVFSALESADLCLLPFGHDMFSVTKSANRAVLALQHGVPVVTSQLASMEPLSEALVFDDWESGLRRYLGRNGKANRNASIAVAREILDRHYSAAATGQMWLDLLMTPSKKLRFGYAQRESEVEIGVLLNLAQDLDVLLPVIDALRREPGVLLRVLLAPNLIALSKRVLRALVDRRIVPFALETGPVLDGEDRILRNMDVLLTASETSLNVHKVAHALTKTADRLGIATFTLQHGLENVGLSYFDETMGPDVRFAARHILTWSDPANLPSIVAPETRVKCIAVGRSSRVEPIDSHVLPEAISHGRVVSVFENLHWHRYSESYRANFLRDLLGLCRARPDLTILLKPHHAGRYLSKNRQLLDPLPENLVFADPLDPVWEPFTAPALIPLSFAVITTPSTVALDAAELDRPVAVIGYDLDLPAYDGMPKLASTQDWLDFVDEADARPDATRARSAAYRDSVRLPGDAVERIVAMMLAECRARPVAMTGSAQA